MQQQPQPRWQQFRANPHLLEPLFVREQMLKEIRSFFTDQDFHEVETPLLVAHPGTEPYLEVFGTTLKIANGKSLAGYLLTSPEYAMKKLLVAGLPKIFQICKSFRNDEGVSTSHNHEFTIMEWYRANSDYTAIMRDCENLLVKLAKVLKGDEKKLNFQGRSFDLSTPWPQISVAELFLQQLGIQQAELLDLAILQQVAQKKAYQLDGTETWDDLFTQLFMNEIEPVIAQYEAPVFVYDYPLPQAALSKPCKNKSGYAERFELYLGGIELANAFSELTDAKIQQARLEAELETRKQLGKTPYKMDADFIAALASGMPESGGIALGIDRLAMVLADVPSIQDVLYFPLATVFDLS